MQEKTGASHCVTQGQGFFVFRQIVGDYCRDGLGRAGQPQGIRADYQIRRARFSYSRTILFFHNRHSALTELEH